MLAIKPTTTTTKQSCTPNILPCKIQHTGPVSATQRHWNPASTSPRSAPEAYFRGRKLVGRSVALPEGYRGVVLEKTKETLPHTPSQSQDEDTVMEDIKLMKEIAGFKELLVWGHEVQPTEAEDEYARGIGEWINFARGMNSY